MVTRVSKDPPGEGQFVAVWKHNGVWWSDTYKAHLDGSLGICLENDEGDLEFIQASWRFQAFSNAETEAFFVYEEE